MHIDGFSSWDIAYTFYLSDLIEINVDMLFSMMLLCPKWTILTMSMHVNFYLDDRMLVVGFTS